MHLCLLYTIAIVMGKPCNTAKYECVCYSRYYTVIKYSFKSLLRKANNSAALFNSNSGYFWQRNFPVQGVITVFLVRITWMCQILLINHTRAAGMYAWVLCRTFADWNVRVLIQNWSTSCKLCFSNKKNHDWLHVSFFWWKAYFCVLKYRMKFVLIIHPLFISFCVWGTSISIAR